MFGYFGKWRGETVLEIAEESDPGGPEPLSSAYRQILALFAVGTPRPTTRTGFLVSEPFPSSV
ncbi:hypothetical protein ACH4TV_42960 [Streptomyces sp. NPDC020898]|uniref:hypothetical protein n=1 Tax=Streptomyces sp. NPDC020898 TaxID=3365101 RepID=UPI0037A6DEA8